MKLEVTGWPSGRPVFLCAHIFVTPQVQDLYGESSHKVKFFSAFGLTFLAKGCRIGHERLVNDED